MVRRIDRRALMPLLLVTLAWPYTMAAQQQKNAPKQASERSGRMITIRGRIDSGLKDRVVEECKLAAQNGVEVVIFDIQSSNSDFGSCFDLAVAIADLSVKRTVAYVSGPLTGHGVLVAMACDEIVMHPEAQIGDVYRDSRSRRPEFESAAYERIARDTGHDPLVFLGMLDESLVIHEVRTPVGKRFVSADKLQEFGQTNRIVESAVVKEAGSTLFLDAAAAERLGLIQRTAPTRRDVALMYEIPETVAADDPLRAEAYRPIVLKLDGIIDNRLYEYVRRRLKQAENGGHNLLFVQIDSSNGDEAAASNIANALAGYGEQARVVAWVPRQATGVAVLLLFACDELVVSRDATIGGFRPKGDGQQGKVLADSAVRWAAGSKYPEAAIRGFIDPNVAVFQVQSKNNPGVRTLVTGEAYETPEIKEQWQTPRPVKEKEVILQLDGERAMALDIATAMASTTEELQSLYDLRGRLPVLQPGWVDAMIQALTSTGGTFFLLFLGVICLYLEFQIPGFGVAGLLSAACFTLFFWSRFLVDQAHSLEIVMFLLGVVFLAVEMFVLPGFGFAGISGLVLIVFSLILATQSFTIPTTAAETRELTVNVITLASVLMVSMLAILGLSRYFPKMPLFNRLVLGPPEEDSEVPPGLMEDDENVSPYLELLGQTGVAVSPLRPAGRMQFAGKFYDVVTRGEFVEPGRPVEVVEVFQNRIIVRDSDTPSG